MHSLLKHWSNGNSHETTLKLGHHFFLWHQRYGVGWWSKKQKGNIKAPELTELEKAEIAEQSKPRAADWAHPNGPETRSAQATRIPSLRVPTQTSATGFHLEFQGDTAILDSTENARSMEAQGEGSDRSRQSTEGVRTARILR